ncbi:MAG: 3-dehydroquinate synthase, partial [Alphaproteobacteria bacterium]|nr:3-dehydroquinate synthase [Alphaproteobacteria bacterium]
DRLLHGEGVAIGMALALQLSVKLGLCPGQDADRFMRHLKRVGLPSSIADVSGPRPSPDVLLEHMAHDKKVKNGRMTFVLVRGIGQAFTTSDVRIDDVRALLSA